LLNDNYKPRFVRSSSAPKPVNYSQSVKRFMDILGAMSGLIVFSPVMLVVALLVRLTMGKDVLFRQMRPGLYGKPFVILKFKTMRDATDKHGKPLADAERLTRLGAFLRSTSLDELPGLINVVKGEMSLVGPRPLLMEYLQRYTPEQARRHNVRPGITGWAQVNGRNAISWDEKFKLDVWYVDNQSLWLDLVVLWKTVAKVVFRQDISHTGHVTMPVFQGQDKIQGQETLNAK
jgi:sugar transferase EpsL